MSKALTLKYRPSSFADLIGQDLNALVLQRLVDTHTVPHGLLFSGPSGTGKTTAARVIAAELNPTQREEIADGTCIDVVEIDAASNGGVGEIRKLIDSLRFQATPGAVRVVIYDECHSITREGWNALLKPIEEGSGTIFIFVTTEPERIPVTVMSRLTEFEFRRVSVNEIAQRLLKVAEAEGISVSKQLLVNIATQAQGNVRSALSTLNLVAWSGITTPEQYQELRGEHDYAPGLVEVMLTGDHAKIFEELDRVLGFVASPSQISTTLVHLLRDLLVLRSKGTLPYSGESLDRRTSLALRVEPDQILATIKLMWDMKTRVRGSQEGIGDLETVLILVSSILSRNRATDSPSQATPAPVVQEAQTPTTSEPPKRMTLADLRTRR